MYAESISDVKISSPGQGYVKTKMAVQHHLENWTFKLFVTNWCIMRPCQGFKVCRRAIWCYLFNFKSWLCHISICRILLVLFWKAGVRC